ncbi:ATPase domain-containing protein [Halobaculum marinum]|uniref:non-specific serine/threonine protein kinase n=1 Tax=Halobaculum marinum TaxID=3031996 RepID=A0ABD5X349_9EURY|nr:ATPase domain-containing protein [Halobaculum sp. DT55]
MGDPASFETVSSGVDGLDTLLNGGFVGSRMYLVLGAPGTGKTTLGMEFLVEGLDNDERVLFVHGEESRENLLTNAAAFGLDLSEADFLDVGPESEFFKRSQTYDIAQPVDVDEFSMIADMREAIERLDPDRILIDPITQLQYIEPTEYQFRRRIIAFMRFLKGRGTTVVATKTASDQMEDQLMSLSDGVISLETGVEGGRISVPKHRGVGQQDGTHGMEIREAGIDVYPALVPGDHSRTFDPEPLSSGEPNLDKLLAGGLEEGTVTILSGPSGVGKSTTATAFLASVAADGGDALAYLFEESLALFSYRAESFGIPIESLRESGRLTIDTIEPLKQSPEEFGRLVRTQVEARDPTLVVIDGIEGYRTAIKGDEEAIDLRRKLHALTRFLTNMNVSVILIDERSEVMGLPRPTSANLSYLADNIVFQNFFEHKGELRRAVGVLKKRVGPFETRLREFEIGGDGLSVGEPIQDMQGVLEGSLQVDDASDHGAK